MSRIGAWARPVGFVAGSLTLVVVLLFCAVALWMWWENRHWVVSAAVDRGDCTSARHAYLESRSGPRGSREVIYGDTSCLGQIRQMLAKAENFSCTTRGEFTVCNHPLNAPDSSTAVRAVVGPRAALLEVTPT